MSNSLSLSPESPILFILLAVLIFLALMAALGSWFRGRGLTRQDAEDLFSTSAERNREELQKFESRLEDTRKQLDKTSADLAARMDRTETGLVSQLERTQLGLVERLERTETGLRGIVEQAGKSQQECLTRDLGGIRTDMTVALAEARRSSDDGIDRMQKTLTDVRAEIELAGTTVRESLIELSRQQQEAKAHSAIQLCEALISSLGTLRNSIAVQIAEEVPTRIQAGTPATALTEFPSTREAGTHEVNDMDNKTPEDHFPDHHSTSGHEAEVSLHEHKGNEPGEWADMGVAADAATDNLREQQDLDQPAESTAGEALGTAGSGEEMFELNDPQHKSWDAVQRNEGGWTPAGTNDVDTKSEDDNDAGANDEQVDGQDDSYRTT